MNNCNAGIHLGITYLEGGKEEVVRMYAACVTRNRMCLHVNDVQPGDCNVPMQRTVGTRLVITLGITTTLLSDSKLGQRM